MILPGEHTCLAAGCTHPQKMLASIKKLASEIVRKTHLLATGTSLNMEFDINMVRWL